MAVYPDGNGHYRELTDEQYAGAKSHYMDDYHQYMMQFPLVEQPRPSTTRREDSYDVAVDRRLTERGDHDDIDESAVQRDGEE